MKLGRMVTVILAAACVVSMAGCGQKQAPAEQRKLRRRQGGGSQRGSCQTGYYGNKDREKIKISISMQEIRAGLFSIYIGHV